jgi:hypothetical protein
MHVFQFRRRSSGDGTADLMTAGMSDMKTKLEEFIP